jgi:hypothetical protein
VSHRHEDAHETRVEPRRAGGVIVAVLIAFVAIAIVLFVLFGALTIPEGGGAAPGREADTEDVIPGGGAGGGAGAPQSYELLEGLDEWVA